MSESNEQIDTRRIQEEEYEVQHFGFSSTSFIQDLQSFVRQLLTTVLEDLRAEIPNDMGEDEKKTYHSQINEFHLESGKVLEKSIKNLEKDIRAYFSIPKNVLLPVDEIASAEYSDNDIEDLNKEIAELEMQYVKKRTFIYLCEKELEILKSLEPVQQRVRDIMKKSEQFTEHKDDEHQKLIKVYEELTKNVADLFNAKTNAEVKSRCIKKET